MSERTTTQSNIGLAIPTKLIRELDDASIQRHSLCFMNGDRPCLCIDDISESPPVKCNGVCIVASFISPIPN